MTTPRRNTRQRTLVLNAVKSSEGHPNAEEIYNQVHEEMPSISLGTVYRNLSLLEQMGQIVRIPSEVGGDRFDGITEDHPHLVCSRCGRVFDLDCQIKKETDLVMKALEQSGQPIKKLCIIAVGLCEDCQKAEQQAQQAEESASYKK